MPLKKTAIKVLGMQKDTSVYSFNPSFAFDNKNIRITADTDNTLTSITNEKGNKLVDISWYGGSQHPEWKESGSYLDGIPIGTAVINHRLVVFTRNASADRDKIYMFWYVDDSLVGRILYSGDLGFNTEYPIETLSSYESENVQKVYWTDGLNQPRFINVADKGRDMQNDKFDFVTSFGNTLSMSVSKASEGTGLFPAGTIQYLVTYYKKYGQETNAVKMSHLYYTSIIDRGAAADETCTCSFDISLSGIDTSFDYVRIYSVQRTSESGTPVVHIVTDSRINGSTFNFTDTGINQQSVDPTLLLYLGGLEVSAGTIEQKDGTLFLGGIDMSGGVFSEYITNLIKNYFTSRRSSLQDILSFSYRQLNNVSVSGVYPYESQLDPKTTASSPSEYKGIKTFKGGEWYRVGIQFMTNKGQWSQAFFIGDVQNDKYPENKEDGTLKIAQLEFTLESSLKTVLPDNIVSYRLLTASSSTSSNTVIAQGIVCPTLFNYRQRKNNIPYSIASWFMRPENDVNFPNAHWENIQSDQIGADNEIEGFSTISKMKTGTDTSVTDYKYSAVVNSDDKKIPEVTSVLVEITVRRWNDLGIWYSKGSYIIYKGNTAAKANILKNGGHGATSHYKLYEFFIKGMKDSGYITDEMLSAKPINYSWFILNFPTNSQYVGSNKKVKSESFDVDKNIFASTYYGANYFVDRSVLTLNTPDLDLMQDRINNSNVKFRLVGMCPVTANATQYKIEASNVTGILGDGAKSEDYNFNHSNLSLNTSGLKTYPLWHDGQWLKVDSKYTVDSTALYLVYPWQRSGSMNGHPDAVRANENLENKSSVLVNKKFANLRFSLFTKFNSEFRKTIPVAVPKVYNTEGSSFTHISNASEGGDIPYQGNYDGLVVHNDPYPVYCLRNSTFNTEVDVAGSSMGYLGELGQNDTEGLEAYKDYVYVSKGIRIKFKSTSHIVFKLLSGQTSETGKSMMLPDLHNDYDYDTTNTSGNGEGVRVPWYGDAYTIINDKKNDSGQIMSPSFQYPYLWIGEFYVDKTSSWMGGTDDNAIESNTWIPAGEAVSIDSSKAYGTDGDTYYQRWDCLKTFPYTEEDENSVIDITSVMVESRTNLDGRYDSLRGSDNILYARPQNFGLVNRGYTQANNFMSYFAYDDKYNQTSLRNQITWTKTKNLAEDIDTWTNLTLASSLDLDGDKGKVTKLKRFRNSLLCFQDSGISEIQYNNVTALSTENGVPVEIANSGKVTGKQYLSGTVGCSNKWSLCEGRNGLYFMDDLGKNIYRLSEGLANLSETKGFLSWSRKNISGAFDNWRPSDFTDFVSYYDSNTNDVYFIGKDTCLGFNEVADQFVSFYSYESTPYMAMLDGKCIAIGKNRHPLSSNDSQYKLWEQREGEYNSFFGKIEGFHTTIVVNPEPTEDKVFNNVEFRSDTWDRYGTLKNLTFDTLETWNEYQHGKVELSDIPGHPSSLKRKFRVWRANIPRSDTNGLDRMRNTWMYLKLSMDNPDTYRTVLHDIIVDYFI